ncbi:MAG: hypothetical protein LUE21_01660 [Oscillospiraceae bacterium]|nr:hypothetical protein [Oscillospiraceae bacterium]
MDDRNDMFPQDSNQNEASSGATYTAPAEDAYTPSQPVYKPVDPIYVAPGASYRPPEAAQEPTQEPPKAPRPGTPRRRKSPAGLLGRAPSQPSASCAP